MRRFKFKCTKCSALYYSELETDMCPSCDHLNSGEIDEDSEEYLAREWESDYWQNIDLAIDRLKEENSGEENGRQSNSCEVP